jgi:hypothetical protein
MTGIAVFLARRLSMSLDQAGAAAKALAGGAGPPTASTGVAEVDMLLDGLRHTSADLARERRPRSALESCPKCPTSPSPVFRLSAPLRGIP